MPPAIRMYTPSGRFREGMRLCLSISDYHPKTWNPAWSVSTILTGLLSFMVSDETTAGSIGSTDEIKRKLARQSKAFNLRSNMFIQHFPELVELNISDLRAAAAADLHSGTSSSPLAVQTHIPNHVANEQASVPLVAATVKRLPVATPAVEVAANLNADAGLSNGKKLICVVFLFVSWLVASKLFTSHL